MESPDETARHPVLAAIAEALLDVIEGEGPEVRDQAVSFLACADHENEFDVLDAAIGLVSSALKRG